MLYRLVLPLLFLMIGLSSLSAQSSYEPEGGVAALDTARGNARLVLLIRLAHKFNRTNPNQAVEYVEEAFDYQKVVYFDDLENYQKQRLALLGFSAETYFYANQKDKALENLNKAFALADSVCVPDKACHQKGLLYAFLGNHHLRMDNGEAAVKAHKAAFPIFIEVEDFHNTATACNNISISFKYQGKLDSALHFINESKKWHKKFDAPIQTMTRLKYRTASLHTEIGNSELSNQLFKEVIGTAVENDLELLSEVQLEFAGIKNDEEEYDEAWQLLQDCRTKVLESGNMERTLSWYRSAAKATKELNISDSSMAFSERYIVMEDSLSKVDNEAKINKLEESVRVKSKDLEIDSLAHQLSGQRKNLLFLLSLLLGALGIAFYYFRKSKQVREQSTLEIRYFLSGKSEINSAIEIDPFLENVLETIEANLSDPAFNVEALASKVFTSRSNLFKKTKPLTGKSPVVLIREMRMEKAKLLLETEQFSVREIAEKVGFEDSSYFGRVYKKYFGVSPSKSK